MFIIQEHCNGLLLNKLPHEEIEEIILDKFFCQNQQQGNQLLFGLYYYYSYLYCSVYFLAIFNKRIVLAHSLSQFRGRRVHNFKIARFLKAYNKNPTYSLNITHIRFIVRFARNFRNNFKSAIFFQLVEKRSTALRLVHGLEKEEVSIFLVYTSSRS